MKKIIFVLSLFMAGLFVNAQVALTDFSGNWNSNAEKSIQPQGNQGGGSLVAKQVANLLTVERTRTGQDGQPRSSFEVNAQTVRFLSNRTDSAGDMSASPAPGEESAFPSEGDDNIPF